MQEHSERSRWLAEQGCEPCGRSPPRRQALRAAFSEALSVSSSSAGARAATGTGGFAQPRQGASAG
eukprot:13150793-Alexandrium_andersonii.AAC.1